MSDVLNGILAGSTAPPWLPRDAQDARNFSYWAQLILLLGAFVYFIWAIINFAWWNFISGVIFFALAVFAGFIGLMFIKKSVIDEIDRGRFHEAKNNMVLCMIIGFFVIAVPGVLLLLAYLKLSEAMSPQSPGYVPVQGTAPSQQYQPPAYQPQQYPPQQYQQPAQQPMQQQPVQQTYYQPPQQASADHKYQMMKCKNCNVQFPAFMTNCPNCGSPK